MADLMHGLTSKSEHSGGGDLDSVLYVIQEFNFDFI